MARTVLLKGEVPVTKRELDALRRKAVELDDYKAAIRAPQVEAIRHRAMAVRRLAAPELAPLQTRAWAQGVADYEAAMDNALLERMRGRE